MTPSLGSSFFAQIKRQDAPGRAEFLQNLITTPSPTFETNYLEFKGCLDGSVLLSNDKIREHYGKTVSAFANTGGGVLIWGITADRNSAGVDSARHLALAPNTGELYSRLDVAESNVTNPPVLGIEKLLVPVNGTTGFVVCFIPESRYRPHAS
jgi:predicted HTH transcriptional regulator